MGCIHVCAFVTSAAGLALSRQNQQLDLVGGCNAIKSRGLEIWGCVRSPPPYIIVLSCERDAELVYTTVAIRSLGTMFSIAYKPSKSGLRPKTFQFRHGRSLSQSVAAV